MIILPTNIEQEGPGIELDELPEGLSIRMADPAPDLNYARNAVTLTFELANYEHVRRAARRPGAWMISGCTTGRSKRRSFRRCSVWAALRPERWRFLS
ncbi:hypothetical protein JXA32_04425 [Candidatus Sumerlaeota bacterium]|nr:hypothetical protein [Candidatus Sumerlaeota bacterium]